MTWDDQSCPNQLLDHPELIIGGCELCGKHQDILPIEKEYRAYKNIKEELQKAFESLRF